MEACMKLVDREAPTAELEVLDPIPTTTKIARSMKDNKYSWVVGALATLAVVMVTSFSGEIWDARDATLSQKGVDKVQDVRIQHVESTIHEIKDGQKAIEVKIDLILERL